MLRSNLADKESIITDRRLDVSQASGRLLTSFCFCARRTPSRRSASPPPRRCCVAGQLFGPLDPSYLITLDSIVAGADGRKTNFANFLRGDAHGPYIKEQRPGEKEKERQPATARQITRYKTSQHPLSFAVRAWLA